MSSKPITLSLELSGRYGSIALMNRDGETITSHPVGGKREEDDVFPSIEKGATSLCITPGEIELVAVSIGPGGFTGLRTSVAIAKMVALASNATIISVETAIVTVQQANRGDGPFLVISCVKGNQFWLSTIVKKDGNWNCVSKNTSTEALASELNAVTGVFADEFIPVEARMLIEQHAVPIYQSAPDAMSLLKIGLDLYQAGNSVDPSELLPLYPREPEAVRIWKARKSKNHT